MPAMKALPLMVKSLSAGVSCPTFFLACREGLGKRRNIPSGETAAACHVEAVIASGAKQSISPRKERMDCFRLRSLSYGGQVVARAPRNDGDPSGYGLSFSRRIAPE